MEQRILGKTGLLVSPIGLGGIPIQRADVAAARTLLRHLHGQGVNYIDTARGYTVSEAYLGQALEEEGLQGKFILATKSMARTKAAMAADIETSLGNLRTGYIDLYQIHNPRTDADFEAAFGPDGAVEAIKDAIAAGKVGHLGATAHSMKSLMELLTHPEIETVMFPYNIVESQVTEALDLIAKNNVGFIAMKPLAGGAITDGRLALRFLLADSRCTLSIPGMAEVAEAEQNLSALADGTPLSPAEQEAIRQVRASLTGNFCRRCGYCAPCTVGIDIPTCFTMESYARRYGLADWGTARYLAMAKRAGDCIDCGKCEGRCPYNLPIRAMLKDVKALFGE